jgi:pimeloyl-ACP methyl ester carboxylesterase
VSIRGSLSTPVFHGLTSNKMQVCMQVAPTLVKQGFAVIAADLPCHGERPGNPFDMVSLKNWESTFPLYKKAVIDIHQLIDLAKQRPDLKVDHGVFLVGYSLGSWMSTMAGPSDDRVKAMVLMVGGAYDIPAALLKNPMAAAADPRLALAHFAGRPLLLLNGKTDGIVAPELSKRLFAAAPEPKKQIWYDSGHLLPGPAYADAAKWLADMSAPPATREAK